MRLVFFNRFYAPDHSATAQILTDLAEHLAGTGYDVTVVTSRALYGRDDGLLPRDETRAGVSIVRTWTPARRSGMIGRIAAYLTFYVTAFGQALRLANRDTVLIVKTDPPLLSLPLGIAASLKRGRAVHWVQDLYPEIAAAYGMSALGGPIGGALRALRNWSFRRAARIVAIGELMAARVTDMGVPAARIAVIPNWTNDAEIVPRADRSPALRATWGIAADAFVLEYSGNLGRAHEYDTVLAAAEILRDRRDIVFLFVGGGHMSQQLATQVAARGLTSFRFAEYQPRERLSESLGTGDAHWISLRLEFEGLIVPSKVFGVCAAARPVIAVCAPGGELPNLLQPGRDCLVVKPGDAAGLAAAIVALAVDKPAAVAMGLSARATLERDYTKQRAFDRWRLLLDAVGSDGATRER